MANDLAQQDSRTVSLSSSLMTTLGLSRPMAYDPMEHPALQAARGPSADYLRGPFPAAIKTEAALVLPGVEAMLSQPADKERVKLWLKHLGILVAGQMTAEDASVKVGAYAALLSYPPMCYTRDTLKGAGREFKFMPSFGELSAFFDRIVSPWQDLAAALRKIRDAVDRKPALPEPQPAPARAAAYDELPEFYKRLHPEHARRQVQPAPPPGPPPTPTVQKIDTSPEPPKGRVLSPAEIAEGFARMFPDLQAQRAAEQGAAE